MSNAGQMQGHTASNPSGFIRNVYLQDKHPIRHHGHAHAGLMGLVYELAADVILAPMSGEPQGGAQGTQPSPEALGWLGLPNPTHVVLPAWIALGLPDPPPEVRSRTSDICWRSWHSC